MVFFKFHYVVFDFLNLGLVGFTKPLKLLLLILLEIHDEGLDLLTDSFFLDFHIIDQLVLGVRANFYLSGQAFVVVFDCIYP